MRKPKPTSCSERAREVGDVDQRQPVERAGGGLGEDAGLGRGVARRGEDRVGAEGQRRAEDRADIVRVGDLVEDDDEAGFAERLDRERIERRDLDRDPLVHGLGAEQPVEVSGVASSGGDGQGRSGLGEAGQGVGRADDTQHGAPRVGEGGEHGMDAVDEETVRPALAGRARRVVWRSSVLPFYSTGVAMAHAWLIGGEDAAHNRAMPIDVGVRDPHFRRVDTTDGDRHKTRHAKLSRAFRATLTCRQSPGGVSRVAKGADCKSAGVRLRRFESYLPHHRRWLSERPIGPCQSRSGVLADR